MVELLIRTFFLILIHNFWLMSILHGILRDISFILMLVRIVTLVRLKSDNESVVVQTETKAVKVILKKIRVNGFEFVQGHLIG